MRVVHVFIFTNKTLRDQGIIAKTVVSSVKQRKQNWLSYLFQTKNVFFLKIIYLFQLKSLFLNISIIFVLRILRFSDMFTQISNFTKVGTNTVDFAF